VPDIFIQFIAVAFGALALGFLLIFFVRRSASLERPRSKRETSEGAPSLPELGFEEFRRMVIDLIGALGLEVTYETVSGNEIQLIARTSGPLTGGKYHVHALHAPTFGMVESTEVLHLIETVKADEAQKGILITTHAFSSEAAQAGQAGSVELIDGQQLRELYEKYVGPLKPQLHEVP
jgi:restriction endonuclease Mrr